MTETCTSATTAGGPVPRHPAGPDDAAPGPAACVPTSATPATRGSHLTNDPGRGPRDRRISPERED